MLAPCRADTMNKINKLIASILRWRPRSNKRESASIPDPHTPVEQVGFLVRRMAAFALDADMVARVELTFRNLQRLCAMCEWHELCQWDLRQDPINAASALLAALAANPR
jgi:hypothetical protein